MLENTVNRRCLSFFGKNDFGALIFSVFEKKTCFWCVKKTKKRSYSSVAFLIGKMKADKTAKGRTKSRSSLRENFEYLLRYLGSQNFKVSRKM